MNEKVVEILVYIMQEIKSTKQEIGDLELLSKDLIGKGYTNHEISHAFSWLFDRMKDNFTEIMRNKGPISPHSFRVLHEVEKMIITPAAYGYLIQLKELDLLNDPEMEQIIEKALMLGTNQVSIDDMKAIVASSLFNPDGPIDNSNQFTNPLYQIH